MIPEIRNLIYAEVLRYRCYNWSGTVNTTPDRQARAGTCPQLLRTSKQIYDEASDVLHEESTATIYLLCGYVSVRRESDTIIVGDTEGPVGKAWESLAYRAAWPAWIARVANIDISFRFRTDNSLVHPMPVHFSSTTVLLDGLASLLAGQPRKRHVSWRLLGTQDSTQRQTVDKVLGPFWELCNGADVTSKGVVQDAEDDQLGDS